jgi:uncharacterized protein DUF1801
MNSKARTSGGTKARGDVRSPQVSAAFEAYPENVKAKLEFLRHLIIDTALATEGVGRLEETLKWGQPSYLTTTSKSGSTIRIDRVKSDRGKYAMYFHCQTNLVATFRQIYPSELTYGGNRSILFDVNDKIEEGALRHCISLALTYRLRKSRSQRKTAVPQKPRR